MSKQNSCHSQCKMANSMLSKLAYLNGENWERTVCVSPACSLRGSGVWVDVDNAWEQYKPEARKMLVKHADSHTSGVSM